MPDASSGPAEKQEAGGPQRKTLKLNLGGAKGKEVAEPEEEKQVVAVEAADDHRTQRAQLELMRTRLQQKEADLRRREAALETAERIAHNIRMEAETAIADAEARVAEVERLAVGERVVAEAAPAARDPEARPVRMYGEGLVRQMLLGRDMEIARLMLLLSECRRQQAGRVEDVAWRSADCAVAGMEVMQ